MQLHAKTLLLLLFTLSPSILAALPNERSITVQGAGAVLQAPDQARLKIQFSERDQQVINAKKVVDEKTNTLTKFLLGKKIARQYINNSLLRVRAEYPTVEQPKPGFVAEREVSVTFTDLALYPETLEFAAALGQVEMQPVELLHSKAAELYEQALITAVDDAKRKASVLAKQSGAKIGAVISINELSIGQPMLRKMAMSVDSGMETGTQMVRAEVSVVFQLLEP